MAAGTIETSYAEAGISGAVKSQAASGRRVPGWAYAVLVLSVMIGGWLRLTSLDAKSISHPEMYVPGIHLPDGISEPAERLTATRVLTGTFSSDTHPPGYYLMMLPWTRAFGTGLTALRLPSAMLGLACVILVFILGAMIRQPLAGVLAAGLLAVNGFHVFWSKAARMFALEGFLALFATILLVQIVREKRQRPIWSALYVLTVLAGVGTDVYFWSLLGAHMIWVAGNDWGRSKPSSAARTQWLALILGSPFIAFAAYQSANTVAELSRDIPRYFLEFSSFAFLLPTYVSGSFQTGVPLMQSPWSWSLRGAVLLCGLVLLVKGCRAAWRRTFVAEEPAMAASPTGAWKYVWSVAALLSAGAILAFVYVARRMSPPEQLHESIRLTQALSVLPLFLALVALFLESMWRRLPRAGAWLRFIRGESALLALLAIVPFALLSALSLARPVLNQRGLMFAAPFLLLLLSYGLLTIRSRTWTAALVALLATAHVLSLGAYRKMTIDPADYGKFAADVTREIRGTDLVFVHKAWYATPILYYVTKDQYNLVGRNYSAAVKQNPQSRVWVVLLYDKQLWPEMEQALTNYKVTYTMKGPYSQAILYEREDSREREQAAVRSAMRGPLHSTN